MKAMVFKALLMLNQMALAVYMGVLARDGSPLGAPHMVPMAAASLLLMDAACVSAGNVRRNRVLSLFCGVLGVDAWHLMLSVQATAAARRAFVLLCPVAMLLSVRFVLLFLFQDGGYRLQRPVRALHLLSCAGALLGALGSERAFACLYGVQFVASGASLLLVLGVHRGRVLFVLKSEWRAMLASGALVGAAFAAFCAATEGVPGRFANFGLVLAALLFLFSVHGMIRHGGTPLSALLDGRQRLLLLAVAVAALGLAVWALSGGPGEMIVLANALCVVTRGLDLLLERNMQRGRSALLRESRYTAALEQLRREEELGMGFSNFLHDDVLQDLLAVRNMAGKAHRPDVQALIIDTLDTLNDRIRRRMQDEHPVFDKRLTARENYRLLLESVAQSFPQRRVTVTFTCPETLFLVEPYPLLVDRLLRELLTNVYRHSDGDRAWVTLAQERGVIALFVSDNGTADISRLSKADERKHKGLASVREQVARVGGTVAFTDRAPHGLDISVSIPMRGDVSYPYFTR